MKKRILLLLVLLLLLTACQTVPTDDDKTLASTPSSSATVPPPSYSTKPSTSTPTSNPSETGKTGYTFIYNGSAPFISIDPDCSGCTVGHLYWVDITTEEVTSILEDQAQESIQEGLYVYFVRVDEPTKIYRTPIGDFTKHEMIYESTHGKVSAMLIDTFTIRDQLVLQFVADNNKFVVLNLDTGEDTIVIEQYYIRSAMFDHSNTDTWEEQTDLVFWGKLDEDDSIQSYRYFIQTGEIREEGECAD